MNFYNDYVPGLGIYALIGDRGGLFVTDDFGNLVNISAMNLIPEWAHSVVEGGGFGLYPM